MRNPAAWACGWDEASRFRDADLRDKRGIMAGQPIFYSGQGFSLLRDKNRFVLTSALRSTVRESSVNAVLCLSKFPASKFLVRFGPSRVTTFSHTLEPYQARPHSTLLPF